MATDSMFDTLSPSLQAAVTTVMLKQHNAAVCKDLLLARLTVWERSLDEYKAKLPVQLSAVIDQLERKTGAIRFALGLPARGVTPPSEAFICAEHLQTILQVANCKTGQEWSTAALSSEMPMRSGGVVGSWIHAPKHKAAQTPSDSSQPQSNHARMRA